MTKITTTIEAAADVQAGVVQDKKLLLVGCTSSMTGLGTYRSYEQAKRDMVSGSLLDMCEIAFLNGAGEVYALALGAEVRDGGGAVTFPLIADYEDALDSIKNNEDIGIIVVDRTDVPMQTLLKTHVAEAEAIGKYRFAVTAGTTADAGTINSGRMWFADPNLVWFRDIGGDGSQSPGYITAAAVAAVISTETDPAMPVHELPVKGFTALKVNRLDDQNDTISSGGLITFTARGGGIIIYRAVTSYTKNAAGEPDVLFQEITTVRTGDYVTEQLRAMLRERYGRVKNTASKRKDIATDMNSTLAELQRREIIEKFSPVVATVSASNSKRVEVVPAYWIIDPINEIKLTSHLIV